FWFINRIFRMAFTILCTTSNCSNDINLNDNFYEKCDRTEKNESRYVINYIFSSWFWWNTIWIYTITKCRVFTSIDNRKSYYRNDSNRSICDASIAIGNSNIGSTSFKNANIYTSCYHFYTRL